MTMTSPTPDPWVRAYTEGERARWAGLARTANPYEGRRRYRHRQGWASGWWAADQDAAKAMARRAASEAIEGEIRA